MKTKRDELHLDARELIVIVGPTGVGKSDFALSLAAKVDGEIINCDVGQFYTPLTIGTAKPDWKREKIPHHLFDILAEPVDFSVMAYRTAVRTLCDEISARGKKPIIVGGSLFYAQALFFPPCELPTKRGSDNFDEQRIDFASESTEQLWERLAAIDPERARALHKNDRYRIERALQLWQKTGVTPSICKPTYDPIIPSWEIIYLTRERTDVYARINTRTIEMLKSGWKEEVAGLAQSWYPFIQKKGFIGYDEIHRAQTQHTSEASSADALLVEKIQQETRHYAKRQETFWRSMKRKLAEQIAQGAHGYLHELNLTFLDVDLYIRQLRTPQR